MQTTRKSKETILSRFCLSLLSSMSRNGCPSIMNLVGKRDYISGLKLVFFLSDNPHPPPPRKKLLFSSGNSVRHCKLLFCSNLTRLPFHFLVIFPFSSFFRIFLLFCSHLSLSIYVAPNHYSNSVLRAKNPH
jgi:hypothetical protein